MLYATFWVSDKFTANLARVPFGKNRDSLIVIHDDMHSADIKQKNFLTYTIYKKSGAGYQSRTDLSSLENSYINRYTNPAKNNEAGRVLTYDL